MGYRGKVAEQERAREMRAEGTTLAEIARELGVSKSSVSLWVRDVRFTPRPRQRPSFSAPNRLHLAKLAEIDEMNQRGLERIETLSDEAFLVAGIALYAGEGGKTLDAAERFWSNATGVPRSQFGKAYRAVPDPSIRRNKHEHGLARVDYSCARTHREVMGLAKALLSCEALPG